MIGFVVLVQEEAKKVAAWLAEFKGCGGNFDI
jgi:hypothetical protein